jgi:hypothetical protein
MLLYYGYLWLRFKASRADSPLSANISNLSLYIRLLAVLANVWCARSRIFKSAARFDYRAHPNFEDFLPVLFFQPSVSDFQRFLPKNNRRTFQIEKIHLFRQAIILFDKHLFDILRHSLSIVGGYHIAKLLQINRFIFFVGKFFLKKRAF